MERTGKAVRRIAVASVVACSVAAAWPRVVVDGGQEVPTQDDGTASEFRPEGPTAEYRRLPALGERSVPMRELQSPALYADENATWLAYLEYEPGVGDRLIVERHATTVEHGGADAEERVAVQATAGRLLRPHFVASNDGAVHLLWCALENGRCRILHSAHRGHEWSDPVALTDAARHCFEPVAVARGANALLIAFLEPDRRNEHRAQWSMRTAVLEDGELGPATTISRSENANVWDPRLTSAPSGEIWAGWTAFRGDDYEVEVRALDRDGKPTGDVESVSRDRVADDCHPALAVDPEGRLWVAYDSAIDPARRTSGPTNRYTQAQGARWSVRCRARDGSWQEPTARMPDVTLSWSGGRPALHCDEGAVHLALRNLHRPVHESGNPFDSQPVYLRLDSRGWSEPVTFAPSGGSEEAVAMARTQSGLTLAWQLDRRIEQIHNAVRVRIPEWIQAAVAEQGVKLSGTFGPSAIGLASVEVNAPSAAGGDGNSRQIPLEPIPGDPIPPRSGAEQWGSNPLLQGTEHATVTSGRKTYRIFWGDLHRHTSMSRCTNGLEMDVEDRYRFVQDICQLDFVAITDHTGAFDPFHWWQQSKWLELFSIDGFVPLRGFECSSSNFGHMNVILREPLDLVFSIFHGDGMTFFDIWRELEEVPSLSIPHHTADVPRNFVWPRRDPSMLRLVEVFQSQRGNYEFPGCYRIAHGATDEEAFVQAALERGSRLGLIASSDHGSGAAYAGVLCESLERGAVFDALRARRTFASSTKGFWIDFRVNNTLMGGTVRRADTLDVSVQVHGIAELAEVVVFRDGLVHRAFGRDDADSPGALESVDLDTGLGSSSFQTSWSEPAEFDRRSYLYVRAIQRDGEVAWSSPIFLRAGRVQDDERR